MTIKISNNSNLPPNETLLGGIGKGIGHYEYDIVPIKTQKQQREEDRTARAFLDDIVYIAALQRKLGIGGFQKLLANAEVPIKEAVVLTGISEEALESLALNIYKQQKPYSFSLLKLAQVAADEVPSAFAFSRRESYQSCVKTYIQDFIKEEYQQFYLKLCSSYFDMDSNSAKAFEASIHVIASYFRMYPPHDSAATINPPSPKAPKKETNPAKGKKYEVPVLRAVAKLLKKTEKTVRNWCNGKSAPAGWPETLNIVEFAKWYVRREESEEKLESILKTLEELVKKEEEKQQSKKTAENSKKKAMQKPTKNSGLIEKMVSSDNFDEDNGFSYTKANEIRKRISYDYNGN